MKRLLTVLILLTVAVAAYAHNGMEHVMGNIAAMTATSVDVKTTKGDMKTVAVNDTTIWMRGPDAVKPGDAHVGDRVVIHARPVNGQLVAAEVEIAVKTHSAGSKP